LKPFHRVVTLDGAGTVLQSNRAFAALVGRRVDFGLGGEKIESLFPADCAEDLAGVIRRGHRMARPSLRLRCLSAAASSIWPSPARV